MIIWLWVCSRVIERISYEPGNEAGCGIGISRFISELVAWVVIVRKWIFVFSDLPECDRDGMS
jgi:hypothetical protein